MSNSVTIVPLVKPDKDKLNLDNNVKISKQVVMGDYNGASQLGSPSSMIKFVDYNSHSKISEFSIDHTSKTVNKTIRIFHDGNLTVNRYQEQLKFKMKINFDQDEMYIFSKSVFADELKKRMLFNELIQEDKELKFNLLEIENHPRVSNVWGIWEKPGGQYSTQAFFGKDISTQDEEISQNNVTAINFNYDYGGRLIALVVNKDRKISSLSKGISNSELIEIYLDLQDSLKEVIQ
jgi:hypothetical protein